MKGMKRMKGVFSLNRSIDIGSYTRETKSMEL